MPIISFYFVGTNKLFRLKWNWVFIILSSSLETIASSSPLGTLHQFLTDPTAEDMRKAHLEHLVSIMYVWQFIDNHAFSQFEAGLGVSEGVYAWAVSANNIGGIFGGISGGILASIIPYWYSLLAALICYTVGALLYGTAQYGWMVVMARLLIGIFSGLQRSLIYAYIAMSYQSYVEIKQRAGKMMNLTKYCRIKDILFSLYTISTSAGYFIGAGSYYREWGEHLTMTIMCHRFFCHSGSIHGFRPL